MDTYQREKAKTDPIAEKFADMIRSCLRAAAAEGEAHIYKAAQHFSDVHQMIGKREAEAVQLW